MRALLYRRGSRSKKIQTGPDRFHPEGGHAGLKNTLGACIRR
ncbi:hypothetical protein [Pseudoflavonifractor sp. MSJ-37]|nr:hypothetical protein [Pseudoflavonifractor sp. MSJ-37]